jgi:hypothetical protein
VNAAKLQVKVFVDGQRPELEKFIPVFHDWIKHHKLPELLIDVANYAHVPKGPGVALIGNDSDYFIDDTDGRPGLLHSRKREVPLPEARLGDAFRRALNAAALLEKAFEGKVRFRTDELLFRINDRLLAPATEATFTELRPELDAYCGKLFAGAGHKLALAGGPKQLFSVKISTDAKVDLATLLARAGGPL